MLTDTDVIDLRSRARSDLSFSILEESKIRGCSRSAVLNAVHGHSFKHLNQEYPPRGLAVPNEKIAIARKLREDGASYLAIARELGVPKSTVIAWCSEGGFAVTQKSLEAIDPTVVEQIKTLYQSDTRIADIAKTVKIAYKRVVAVCRQLPPRNTRSAPAVRSAKRGLTNRAVIAIRREIGKTGVMNLGYYAGKYKVSPGAVSMAARGLTFKYLDHIATPIVTIAPSVKRKPGRPTKPKPDEGLIAKLIARLERETARVTLESLSDWMTQESGRDYRPNHIATLLRNRREDLLRTKTFGNLAKPVKPKKRTKPAHIIKTLQKRSGLTLDEILSDDDAIPEEEMLALIAAEDARCVSV